MVNFGPLTAEIDWWVWGTPANFNGFRIFASFTAPISLNGGQPYFARCLAVFFAIVHYIHIFGGSWPLTGFFQVQIHFAFKYLRYPILAALLHGIEQWASAKLCGVVQGMQLRNFRRGRHLYSAGRPSRWASAHILV